MQGLCYTAKPTDVLVVEMVNKEPAAQMSMPIIGMLVMGILSAIIVSLQVAVVPYWPQPASVAPNFGWETGFWWGLVAGGLVGLYIGFILDEKNYDTLE